MPVSSVEAARPKIVAALVAQGGSPLFAACVVDQLPKSLSGSDLAFALGVLGMVAPSPGDLDAVATSNGVVDGSKADLPQRIGAVEDSCRSVDRPGMTAGAPGSAVPAR